MAGAPAAVPDIAEPACPVPRKRRRKRQRFSDVLDGILQPSPPGDKLSSEKAPAATAAFSKIDRI